MNRNTHHIFNKRIAKEFGINSAIILENMMFWLDKNEANNTNYFEGKYWTYNSISAYAKIFDYLSERQIKYALDNLEEKGIIETGIFNKKHFDRTKWYTITDYGYRVIHNVNCISTKCQMDDDKVYEPIPYVNTYINTDNKDYGDLPKSPTTSKYDKVPYFNEFWELYPNKKGKGQAVKTFQKQVKNKETFDLIVKDLERRKGYEGWIKEDGRFIQHPSTYLNQEMWLDEYEVKKIKQPIKLKIKTY